MRSGNRPPGDTPRRHATRSRAPRPRARRPDTWTGALAAGLLLLAATGARARPDAPPAIAAAAGGQEDITRSVLIGPGGQVYEPGAPGAWARRFGGGVSIEVAGAVRVDAGTLFVHGARTPLFRLQDASWHASPLPNRGRCVLGAGAAPALAIGRHVYTWRGGRWTRLASVRGTITAVWAASDRQALAATAQGRLFRVQAGRRRQIPHSLAAGDALVQLAGHPRKRLFGLARSGAVLRIGTRAATLVATAPALSGWEPQVAAADARGVLWVLGWLPARAQQPARAVLARTVRGTLVPAEFLDGLAAQDRFVALRLDPRGGMLWATQSGTVRYRRAPAETSAEGARAPADASWQDARIIRELPRPVSSFPGRAPARTR